MMLAEHAKAVIALILAVLTLGTLWLGWDVDHITEDRLIAVFAILSPILVWLIPNKPARQAR